LKQYFTILKSNLTTMMPHDGPAVHTRSRSASAPTLPPSVPTLELQDTTSFSATIVQHRDSPLGFRPIIQSNPILEQNLPRRVPVTFANLSSDDQNTSSFQSPTLVPQSDTLGNISPIFSLPTQRANNLSPHMMDGFYANNRINYFHPGQHDQMQFPLDRGFDFRNPGIYSYPTQYTQPMYSGKTWQSYQDYQFPPQIPTGPGFQSHPYLQPVPLPEIFRTNTHYLWAVKEYSINKVTNTLLATIAKSDLKAIASVDSTAFLQLRDFLLSGWKPH
jgi:Neuraminidase (sialidase)